MKERTGPEQTDSFVPQLQYGVFPKAGGPALRLGPLPESDPAFDFGHQMRVCLRHMIQQVHEAWLPIGRASKCRSSRRCKPCTKSLMIV